MAKQGFKAHSSLIYIFKIDDTHRFVSTSILLFPSSPVKQTKKKKRKNQKIKKQHTQGIRTHRQKAHVPEGPLPNPSWYTLTAKVRAEARVQASLGFLGLFFGFCGILLPLRHMSRVNFIANNYEHNPCVFFFP